MKITSKKVAKDLGISEATVSLALNDKPGINEETKQHILDYINDLKEKKRPLNKVKSNKIIKMVFYVKERALYDEQKANLFTVPYMEIYNVINKLGMELKFVYVDTREEAEKVVRETQTDKTSGILLWGSELKREDYIPFENIKIPMVISDFEYEDINRDCVIIDNKQIIKLIIDYLIEKGHENLAYFYNTNHIYNFNKREEEIIAYSKQVDLNFSKDCMFEVGTMIDNIIKNVKKYIEEVKNNLPSAIICENYAISIGAIKAIQDMGYNIPKDISVIGIDELPSYVFLNFEYTYVKVFHEQKAFSAVKRLIDILDGKPDGRVLINIQNQFVEGNSVKKIY